MEERRISHECCGNRARGIADCATGLVNLGRSDACRLANNYDFVSELLTGVKAQEPNADAELIS